MNGKIWMQNKLKHDRKLSQHTVNATKTEMENKKLPLMKLIIMRVLCSMQLNLKIIFLIIQKITIIAAHKIRYSFAYLSFNLHYLNVF